jgi:hypothetical protein
MNRDKISKLKVLTKNSLIIRSYVKDNTEDIVINANY